VHAHLDQPFGKRPAQNAVVKDAGKMVTISKRILQDDIGNA